MGFVPGNLQKLFDILEEDENVDAVAMEVGASFIARRLRENPAMLDQMVATLAAHKERSAKPFLAIAHPGHVEDVMADIRSRLIEKRDRDVRELPGGSEGAAPRHRITGAPTKV